MPVIVDHDRENAEALAAAIGPGTAVLPGMDMLHRHLEQNPYEDVVVLTSSVDSESAFRFAEVMRVSRPALGVVLVRRRVDTSLLADALRCGVREVVTDRDLSGLSEAVRRTRDLARRIRRQVDGAADSGDDLPRGRVVTVFAAKGGCGKTTLATNVAYAIADRGRRNVCLLDLDLAFGDVAIALQLFPAHTIADALPLADSLDEAGVSGLLTPHSPGFSALVAPTEPGTAERIPATLVTDLLIVLRRMFDYVVVDTPPAFTDHVLAAFDTSEVIALLATLDIPAIKNLKLTLETLELLNYPRDRWRIIINRADSKVGLSLSDVEKTLSIPIVAQIPSSRDVPSTINRGVTIVQDEPSHPVSISIRQFAEQIAALGTTPAISERHHRRERRSLLRKRATTRE